jgi:hypothetical protein
MGIAINGIHPVANVSSTFRNNIVSINSGSTNKKISGFHIADGYNTLYHNTVSITGSNAGTDEALTITDYNSGNIENNTFANLNSGSGTHNAVHVINTALGTFDYNDYVGALVNFTGGVNSVTDDPLFANSSGTTLVSYIPAATTLIGTTSLMATIPDDIDGTLRCVPTMGAQEFRLPPLNVAANATPNPVCQGDTLFLTGSATGATSWYWTGPNGWTSTLQNPFILNMVAAASGIYTLYAINACDSAAPVTVNVSVDTQGPTFTAIAPRSFCVQDILQASYFDPTMDITPARPEYYLFKPGDTSLDLNPATFADNCCAPGTLVIHWQIDFNGGSPVPITGTGQPSTYGTDIELPGDGTLFTDLVHTITYWLVDCNGNTSANSVVNITIKPRPDVIKN